MSNVSAAILVRSLDADLVARSAEAGSAPAKASNTVRAYASDLARFEDWCQGYGLCSLPAREDTIRTYLVSLADEGLKHSTVARAYAAIRSQHASAGARLPTLISVTNFLKSLGRAIGVAPQRAEPLMASALKLAASEASPRDAAMLLVGFAAALRRSEIVALNVSDVRFTEDGAIVTIRRSKTDQAGAGREVAIPHGQAVRALRAWLAGKTTGAIFTDAKGCRLAPQAVARIVKKTVGAEYSGHSLRAGLATSAAKAGKSLASIMKTTGHKSERVAMTYIRHGSLFDDCASEGLL